MKRGLKKVLLTALAVVVAFGLKKVQADAHAYYFVNDSTQTTITLSWDASFYGDKKAEGFTIYWNEGTCTNWEDYRIATSSGNKITFRDLKPGTPYAFNVQCTLVDKDGNREYNQRVLHACLVTKPGKVDGLSLTPAKDGKSAKITWKSQVACDYEYEVADLNCKKIAKLSGVVEQESGITKTKATIKGLNPSKGYLIRVRAKYFVTGGTQYGPWTPYKKIFPNVKLTKAVLKDGVAKLTWKDAKDFDSFEIYASKKAKTGFRKVASAKKGATTASFKKYGSQKLKAKTTYYVYVAGVKKINGTKNTVKSNIVKVVVR